MYIHQKPRILLPGLNRLARFWREKMYFNTGMHRLGSKGSAKFLLTSARFSLSKISCSVSELGWFRVRDFPLKSCDLLFIIIQMTYCMTKAGSDAKLSVNFRSVHVTWSRTNDIMNDIFSLDSFQEINASSMKCTKSKLQIGAPYYHI